VPLSCTKENKCGLVDWLPFEGITTTTDFLASSAADQFLYRWKIGLKGGEDSIIGLFGGFIRVSRRLNHCFSVIGKNGFGATIVDI